MEAGPEFRSVRLPSFLRLQLPMKAWMEEVSEEGSFQWLSRLERGFQVRESYHQSLICICLLVLLNLKVNRNTQHLKHTDMIKRLWAESHEWIVSADSTI